MNDSPFVDLAALWDGLLAPSAHPIQYNDVRGIYMINVFVKDDVYHVQWNNCGAPCVSEEAARKAAKLLLEKVEEAQQTDAVGRQVLASKMHEQAVKNAMKGIWDK